MARFATRSSIQFCTSSDSHATLQAPSRTRVGNWPAASNRAICAKLYGTPKTLLNSFLVTSFCVIGHSPRKGSIAMLARNQLAGEEIHTVKWLHVQRAHSSASQRITAVEQKYSVFGGLFSTISKVAAPT